MAPRVDFSPYVAQYYKSSAVAEMGDRGHNTVGCHSSA